MIPDVENRRYMSGVQCRHINFVHAIHGPGPFLIGTQTPGPCERKGTLMAVGGGDCKSFASTVGHPMAKRTTLSG